jgi:transcriptional regulator with XRE-family HTH domain
MNEKLKIALLNNGSHQYEVARETGISETRLSRLVRGREDPTAEERRRLSAFLGVRQRDLFGFGREVAK